MKKEQRDKIIQDALVRQQRSAATAPPQAAPTPAQEVRIRTHGNERDLSVKLVDKDNPPTPRRRTNVVMRQQTQTMPQGPRQYGASTVDPNSRIEGPRVRPQPEGRTFGAKVVHQTQSSTGVRATLSQPLNMPQSQPPMGAVYDTFARPAASHPNPAPTTQEGPVTVILSQYSRPAQLESVLRALNNSTMQPQFQLCWVNPRQGITPPNALLGRIPHVYRASSDDGPWMRWTLVARVATKYVLMLDDDCVIGPDWIRQAVERLEQAEQAGESFVVASAGAIYQSDRFDDVVLIGPENPERQERLVDTGRGAWLMHTDFARAVNDYPTIGSPLATSLHVAAATQAEGSHGILVLPYAYNDKSGWGMCEPPKTQGSIAEMLHQQQLQGLGFGVEAARRHDYDAYRGAGWEPLSVMMQKAAMEDASEQAEVTG